MYFYLILFFIIITSIFIYLLNKSNLQKKTKIILRTLIFLPITFFLLGIIVLNLLQFLQFRTSDPVLLNCNVNDYTSNKSYRLNIFGEEYISNQDGSMMPSTIQNRWNFNKISLFEEELSKENNAKYELKEKYGQFIQDCSNKKDIDYKYQVYTREISDKNNDTITYPSKKIVLPETICYLKKVTSSATDYPDCSSEIKAKFGLGK